MNRGDRCEAIFLDDVDRQCLLATLRDTCQKTNWQVHAYCLMGNHFHLVVETPQPNLVMGMKWFMQTYTSRFNRRHRYFGHLQHSRAVEDYLSEQARAAEQVRREVEHGLATGELRDRLRQRRAQAAL